MGLGLIGAGTIQDLPPIVAAAKDQDWVAVGGLLDHGADPNAEYGDGTTALHWASYWDSLEGASRLIEAGANVNATTDLGVPPLWPAAQNGSERMVEALLAAGADPRATLRSGETVLQTAALAGDPGVVRRLLAAGADPNTRATRDQTVLMWAAGQGHAEVVALLVEYGADINAQSAVRTQYMKTEKDQESNSEYHVWVQMGGSTALMFAARAAALDAARVLVDAGADVNRINAFGISPSIMAIHGGGADLVELFLEAGADPNSMDAGYSALHAAILHGDRRAVQALLRYGADVNAPLERPTPTRRGSDDYHFHNAFVGATPFWLAARFTEPDVMRLLLEAGADPLFIHYSAFPAGDREQQWEEVEGPITPLMAALGMGGWGQNRGFHQPPLDVREAEVLAAVKLAREVGHPVTGTDAAGRTLIEAASRRGFDSVIQFLNEAE